jgi:proteic killer suppression protein
MMTTTQAAASPNMSRSSATFSSGSMPRRYGFRLHPLKGEFKGFWAVTVRANWRMIFRFVDPDAVDVDYMDNH